MVPDASRDTFLSRHAGWWVWASVFIVLLVCRWPVLTMPLYEDQSVGFGREADYLDQTNFDYYSLRYKETHFLFGGTARSYMISILPTMLALLRRAMGSVEATLVVWHLLSFALAAGIVALVFGILRRSVPTWLALAASLGVLTTPMFLVQADVAGMELPLALPALLACRSLVDGRYAWSVGWSAVAFFVKATGLLVLVSVLIILVFLSIFSHEGRQASRRALAIGVVALVGLLALLAWADDTAFFRATFEWPTEFRLPTAGWWCPDLVVLTALTFVALLGAAWTTRRAGWLPGWMAMRQAHPAWLSAVWAGMIVVGSLVSMANYIYIPRYCVLPAIVVFIPLAIGMNAWRPSLGGVLLVVISAVGAVNHAGRLYPSIERIAGDDLRALTVFTLRSCGFTERSLEYLADHRSAIEAVHRSAEIAKQGTIFADMPHWIYLTSPFVGYVPETPTGVVRADQYTRTIRRFRDQVLSTPVDHEIGFLWSAKASGRMPRISPAVDIVYQDTLQPPLAVLRVRRSELPTDPEAIEDWYLDQTWDDEHALDRVLNRYEFLRRTGRWDRARRELEFARWLFPNPRDRQVRTVLPVIQADLSAVSAQSQSWSAENWWLELDADAQASFVADATSPSLVVATNQVASSGVGSVRLHGPRRRIEGGDRVGVVLRMRASRPCEVAARWERIFEPGRPFVEPTRLALTTDWQEIRSTWTATSAEHDAGYCLELGRSNARFELAEWKFETEPGRSTAFDSR